MSIFNDYRWDGLERQWKATGGPTFSTTINTTQGGIEQRKQNWFFPRGKWSVGDRIVKYDEYQELLSFFNIMRGSLYGFRLRDWTDYKDDGRGVLGFGVGQAANNTYKMRKSRTIAGLSQTYFQRITRPIGPTFALTPFLGNTIAIFVDGVEQTQDNTSPYSAGTWRVNDEIGECVYTPVQRNIDESFGSVSAGGSLATIQFTASHNYTVGQTLTISGLTGPSAALNSTWRIFAIPAANQVTLQAITGSAPYVGAMTGSGIALDGFGAGQTITWTGEYDYPARFENDSMEGTQIEHYTERAGDFSENPTQIYIKLPTINMIEIKENLDAITQ